MDGFSSQYDRGSRPSHSPDPRRLLRERSPFQSSCQRVWRPFSDVAAIAIEATSCRHCRQRSRDPPALEMKVPARLRRWPLRQRRWEFHWRARPGNDRRFQEVRLRLGAVLGWFVLLDGRDTLNARKPTLADRTSRCQLAAKKRQIKRTEWRSVRPRNGCVRVAR